MPYRTPRSGAQGFRVTARGYRHNAGHEACFSGFADWLFNPVHIFAAQENHHEQERHHRTHQHGEDRRGQARFAARHREGLLDQGAQKVDALKSKVVEAKDQAIDRGSDLLDRMSTLIKAHPIKSVAIAFGAGYIGMRLFRR